MVASSRFRSGRPSLSPPSSFPTSASSHEIRSPPPRALRLHPLRRDEPRRVERDVVVPPLTLGLGEEGAFQTMLRGMVAKVLEVTRRRTTKTHPHANDTAGWEKVPLSHVAREPLEGEAQPSGLILEVHQVRLKRTSTSRASKGMFSC